MDFFSILPRNLTCKILTNTDFESLKNVRIINKYFKKLVNDEFHNIEEYWLQKNIMTLSFYDVHNFINHNLYKKLHLDILHLNKPYFSDFNLKLYGKYFEQNDIFFLKGPVRVEISYSFNPREYEDNPCNEVHELINRTSILLLNYNNYELDGPYICLSYGCNDNNKYMFINYYLSFFTEGNITNSGINIHYSKISIKGFEGQNNLSDSISSTLANKLTYYDCSHINNSYLDLFKIYDYLPNPVDEFDNLSKISRHFINYENYQSILLSISKYPTEYSMSVFFKLNNNTNQYDHMITYRVTDRKIKINKVIKIINFHDYKGDIYIYKTRTYEKILKNVIIAGLQTLVIDNIKIYYFNEEIFYIEYDNSEYISTTLYHIAYIKDISYNNIGQLSILI